MRKARGIVHRKKEVDLDQTPLLSEPVLQRKVHTLSNRAAIPEVARFDTVCTPPSRLSDSGEREEVSLVLPTTSNV